MVEQTTNVILQQGDQQTTTVIYKQQPTSMDKSQIIYNAKDVPSQQQPNVQYVPIVVPLENQQQPLQQVEAVPVQIQAAAVPAQPQVVPQELGLKQPPQVEAVPAPGVVELAPASVVLASSLDQETPAAVATSDTRDKVSVLSQFGHSPIVCQPHPHPILKLDVSRHQVTETDQVSGWFTAPIIVTQDLDRAGHVSRRGSLPVSQLSGSLLAPARATTGLNNGLGPGFSGTKAHSAESSPKRVSVSQYSSIAHKLPFPSQSLRRRSADPSDLLGYRTNPGSQRTSPTSILGSEDLGLLSLLDQRRASGGSCLPLSPVWESGPGLARQYNMMTIREVMSLCGSTTSLASTQVTQYSSALA